MESQGPNGDPSYALGKLQLAIDVLATHPGRIRDRLLPAFMEFAPLLPRDFPKHLRDDFEWMSKQLGSLGLLEDHKGDVVVGAVEATLLTMVEDLAVKIAERLIELEWKLEAHIQDQEASNG